MSGRIKINWETQKAKASWIGMYLQEGKGECLACRTEELVAEI